MRTWQDYWSAYQRLGSARAVAREFGVDSKAVRRSIARAKKRGDVTDLIDDDAGIQSALAETGVQPEHARRGWIHKKNENGNWHTVEWNAPKVEADPDELLEAIKAGLSDIEPVKDIPRPASVSDDLCNVWPFFDVHWGMHAWRKETLGDDYDLKLARADMMQAVENLVWVVPHAKEAVVIFGGDTFHADDTRSETPASKHKLDVDGRHFRVVEELIGTLVRVIHRLLSFHETVTIRVMRGNHDPHSHLILTFALDAYFKSDRVTVVKDPADLFMKQWGTSGIFAHHGDRIAKPVDLALKLADVCRFWSETRHRHAYTGHLHKMEAQRVGGLNWERVEPFAPADGYGSSWVNRRGLKVDTYSKTRGRISSAYDPLTRD
jgi:hypothetical protein